MFNEEEEKEHIVWADELGEFFNRLVQRHDVPLDTAAKLTVDYQRFSYGIDQADGSKESK